MDEEKILDLEQEMADFLRNNHKRYSRFMEEIRNRYQSLGVVGGSIYLNNLNEEEKDLLCKIDIKYLDVKDAKISVKKFLKVFSNTRFSNCNFERVLKLYFNNNLQTKKEIQRLKLEEKEGFFQGILDKFSQTPGGNWLAKALENKGYGYQRIIKEYEGDKNNLTIVLEKVIEGLNYLHDFRSLERLAIFSSKLTKDPHFFDENTLGGQLLLYGLGYFKGVPFPENSEEKKELLYCFGLLKDEISNYTVCGNIQAITAYGIHHGIAGFVENNEPIHLNLWNLSSIEEIYCQNKVIFVFENPSVFSEVFVKTQKVKPSLLCSSGQLKLASLVFLDKGVANLERIYYAGDFDPEGLQIAEKLKKRYGEKLVFWRYDIDNYRISISNNKYDDNRRKKLEGITSKELAPLVKEMLDKGYCGYQELLIEDYVKDIIHILKGS
ncbi:TIGR02679 domain-containing protein [Anaerobranca gottschalkii]|uniref:TIGR02679 family protein n=1 Tax=Anaerobranca gottschalkii DSM 13577 TaxID=1120990 RepID=A0A1H9ZGY0_9FIRM|nr:TIGR02679 domain-containing protein [Anaerobranca gottschalkii]SES80858.1 TIGR02679 family protein [Anaerobranca gottschalkii DSM 13577]